MRPFEHTDFCRSVWLLALLSIPAGLGCDKPTEPAEPTRRAEAPQATSANDESAAPGEADGAAPKPTEPTKNKPPENKPRNPLGALLGAICDAGEATEEGCKACPEFTLQGDDDQPFRLVASAGVKLTSPTARERLVTFQGCTTHSANDRWTVLVARRGDRWQRITELANTEVDECERLANADGREMVACVRRDAARGTNTTGVHALIGTLDGEVSTKVLTSVEGSPGKCQQGAYRLDELRDVYAEDADGDGDEDLHVTIDKRSGQVPAGLESTCSQGFYAPREAERFVFVNEGNELKCCR
jgi:hypothetical protein